jgi:hypothetical protein
VFPSTGNNVGTFGDNSLDTRDLLALLRVITKATPPPPACSDLFDAMDLFPADTNTTRGGDGSVDTRDLLVLLRRITGADQTRPTRTPRGQACP